MNPETVAEHLYEIAGKISELPPKLEAIHSEVKRTNGRVTKLEDLTAEMAKLVSGHSGEFVRKGEEFKMFREETRMLREMFDEHMKARDKRYEQEADDRKAFMAKLWKVAAWAVTLLVSVGLAFLGVEAVPNIPGL